MMVIYISVILKLYILPSPLFLVHFENVVIWFSISSILNEKPSPHLLKKFCADFLSLRVHSSLTVLITTAVPYCRYLVLNYKNRLLFELPHRFLGFQLLRLWRPNFLIVLGIFYLEKFFTLRTSVTSVWLKIGELAPLFRLVSTLRQYPSAV